MKKTPQSERPRERLLNSGSGSLSLRECLAILIQSGPPGIGCLGLASQILVRFGSLLPEEELERAFFLALESDTPALLTGVVGLGSANRARIMAGMEIGKRYALFLTKNRLLTQEPNRPKGSKKSLLDKAIVKVEPRYRNEILEWLGFVSLFRNDQMGSLCLVQKGTRSSISIDPCELFAAVLSSRPIGFFLFHNHPSGRLDPSEADLHLTTNVARVSADLGLVFLGHAIVTSEGQNWIYVV